MAEAALLEKETRFQNAFAHAPVGMGSADLEGRFLHVNAAYCRITGYSEPELLQSGLTFQKLAHPHDLGKNLENLQRLTSGEIPAFFYEKRYLRKDGTTAWVRASGSLRRSPEGKNDEIIGIIEDISGRKNAEQNLYNLNRKLERQVAERTRVARDRAKKLQALVVDDHRVVRQGLSTLLKFHSDIEIAGEARHGDETVEKTRELNPHVILMDISILDEFPDLYHVHA